MTARNYTRRNALSFAAALAAALPLTACSSTTTAPSSAESGSTSHAESKSILRFANTAPTPSLDTAQSPSLETRRISAQILDTLVFADADTGSPKPALAESWNKSGDGKQYTFILRKGVTFHDGSAFSTQSVIDNVERWKKLATASERLATAPYKSFFTQLSPEIEPLVKSVTANENSVIFTLTRPSNFFLPALTQSAFGIAKSGSWDSAGYIMGSLIGTGAFVLSSWENQVAELSLFDHYWGNKPQVAGIRFSAVDSSDHRYYQLMQDQIDAYDQVDGKVLVPLAKSGIITQMRDPYASITLDLNLEHPVLSNVFIRRAIAHAVSKRSINSDILLQGSYESHSYLARSLQISDDNLREYFSTDQDLARALIQRSGYKNEPIEFWYPHNVDLTAMPEPEAIYAQLAANLVEVGLNIVPRPISYSDGYLQKITTENENRGISLICFFGAYRDPMTFFEQLIARLPQNFFSSSIDPQLLQNVQPKSSTSASPTPSPTSTFDLAEVAIPEVDSQALAAITPAELLRLTVQADQPLETDQSRTRYVEALKAWSHLMPAIPIAFAVSAVAQGKKVSSLSVSNLGVSRWDQAKISD